MPGFSKEQWRDFYSDVAALAATGSNFANRSPIDIVNDVLGAYPSEAFSEEHALKFVAQVMKKISEKRQFHGHFETPSN
jgi:hypothetical protein